MRCLNIFGPQMNANKRKCFLGVFTKYSGVRQLLCDSKMRFAINNSYYLRSFALTCMDVLMSWAHGSARATICGK